MNCVTAIYNCFHATYWPRFDCGLDMSNPWDDRIQIDWETWGLIFNLRRTKYDEHGYLIQ